MYKGFRFRLVLLPDNEIGICVDVARKYVSRYPLPTRISEDEFRHYKFKKCIYEYGKQWYEIRIEGLHDLNATEFQLPNSSKTLFDDVHEKSIEEKSQMLLTLPKDSTVLIYHTPEGAPRHVPSGLCRFTYKTSHKSIKGIHYKTIIPPRQRKEEIEFVINHYFDKISFQGTRLILSHQPYGFEENELNIPDLRFGNSVVLTTKSQNNGKVFVPINELGKGKRDQLQASDAGFYVKKNLDQQYIIIPKSVYESYGKKLISDIKYLTNKMYPQPNGATYDPQIITYDDSVEKSIPKLGKAIIDAVASNFAFTGFGLVIIPSLPATRYNKEDELGNLVMRQLRQRGVYVSIMHTEVPSRSYTKVSTSAGSNWQLMDDQKIASRFKGYLSNVILNKIMILNSCWPFVLDTQLHADLIIGIDVKNNTAGFTFVYRDQTIRFFHSDSEQREQLSKRQLETKIYEFVKDEQERKKHEIKNITIHRDGRIFLNEIDGIKQALQKLTSEGMVSKDYSCNFLAIQKSSSTPLRLFKVDNRHGAQFQSIDNPTIGSHMVSFDQAFLCTAGFPYRYNGTSIPLQITKIDGTMDFKYLLEDVFWLSNLTWTKIDYCSKLPISIKMVDIRLREIAGQYSEDALDFGSDGEGEEADE